MIRLLKFHFSYFRESQTPYYVLFPNFVIHHYYLANVLLFTSFCCFLVYPPNPDPVQIHKFNDTSSLGAYEPFCSSSPQTKLRIALLNACSVCNKSAVIYNHIPENSLDILCITETWINNGDISSS